MSLLLLLPDKAFSIANFSVALDSIIRQRRISLDHLKYISSSRRAKQLPNRSLTAHTYGPPTPTTMASSSVTFRVSSETFQTSYTIFGDLESGTRLLVVLNCFPGLPHSYILPHPDLHKTHCRPVVLYDQLGMSESTRVHDKPAGFLTPALVVAELNKLIGHLPWSTSHNFDLFVQSWGVTLAHYRVHRGAPAAWAQALRRHGRRRFVPAVEGGARGPAQAVAAGLPGHDEPL